MVTPNDNSEDSVPLQHPSQDVRHPRPLPLCHSPIRTVVARFIEFQMYVLCELLWVHTFYIREIISGIKVFVCLLARDSNISSRLADAPKGDSC